MAEQDEDALLRSVALQNAHAIMQSRERSERELHAAREALHESRERLQAALNAAGTGTFRWSLQTDILECDENLNGLFGLAPGESMPTLGAFLARVHEDDRAAVAAACARCSREGVDIDMVYRVVLPDGSIRWLADRGKTVADETGVPSYMTGACIDITAHRRAEDTIREGALRLQLALAAGRLGDWGWDAKTDVVNLSARAAELFDLPRGSAIRWADMRRLLHRDDRELARIAVDRALAERIDYAIEYRVLRAQGGSRWIAATGRGIYDAHGAVRGMIGVVQDITARKHSEQALRTSEERLRLTFAQAAVGIATAGVDGFFIDANDKFLRIMGYALEDLARLTVMDLTHPDDRLATRESLSRLLAGEIVEYVLEKRFVRKDGAVVWGRTTVTSLRAAEGGVERFIGVVEDITQRKLAEQALGDETRILESLNRTGAMLASQLDIETLLQTVTDSATQASGAQFGAFFYNTIDADGEAFMLYTLSGAPREAFEPFGHPRATPLFGPTFRGEGVIRCDDVLQDPRYGQWSPHHGMPPRHPPVRSYLAVPVASRTGEVIGGLFFGHSDAGVFNQRTERIVIGLAAQAAVAIDNARLYEQARSSADERKELLEREQQARIEAERASAMKDEFLATLSHELRTPLSAILGWSQVLRMRAMEPQELRQGLETIERNARVQTQLIEDLLDMSRITSGTVRLDIQTVYPVTCIEAAIETVRPAAEAKGIRMEAVLDPAAGPIMADPGRVQQIVWNLLSNAVKFTSRQGKVQVLLQRVNSHIEIGVADTGAGIEPEFLPYLFERFRQADASTTRSHGGLGLGLSIVKHLVELQGGTVRADSAGVGKGATFTVELPLTAVVTRDSQAARIHPRTPTESLADFKRVDLSGLKVLAVDDEADARELIRRVLEECHAEVITAGSAMDALAILQQQAADVIVSDIGMPGMDGYELLRRIRSLGGEAARIPAIALTAFARSEDRTKALLAGYLVHVSKPVEPSELVATVQSAAGRAGRSQA